MGSGRQTGDRLAPETSPDRSSGPLEREQELARIGELLGDIRRGAGRAALIVGPAGIGKTTLCLSARERARAAGVRLLEARGDELERELSFGVARQLLSPLLCDAPPAARRRLLAGGARAAVAVLESPPEAQTAPVRADRSFGAICALHQLALNACAREPILLLVDDCHWADAGSLRWLRYLAARLRGAALGLLVTWREGEEGALERWPLRLARDGLCESLSPEPLSAPGIAWLLGSLLHWAPGDELVRACAAASGGNPLLLVELARALEADGARSPEDAARRVRELGPRSVARAVALRLGGLGREAVELVAAAAVLGDPAELRHLSALSGLTAPRVLELFDRISAAGILRGELPLRFTHPIVRQAIYLDLPEGARSLRHRRAAAVLHAEGADPERVCAHLLRCEPEGSEAVVGMLREGAAAALSRGAPGSAVAYLTRALAEGAGRALRVELLIELGRAEKLVRDPRGIEHLREAIAARRDPLERAELAGELAELLGLSGAWDEAFSVLEDALEQLRALADEAALALRGRLEAYRTGLLAYDPMQVAQLEPRLGELLALCRAPGPSQRALAAALAQLLAWRGDDLALAGALHDHALGEPRAAALIETEPLLAMRTLAAARLLEREQVIERLSGELADEAKARGSVLARVIALAYRGGLRARRGELRDAEEDLRAVVGLCEEHAVGFAMPSALWLCADALIERTELSDVAQLASTLKLPADLARTASGALVLELRGRLAIASGDVDSARAALGEAAAVYRALGLLNPVASPWRSELALSVLAEDRPLALALAADELEAARRVRSPRAEAVALRALGMIEGGERGIGLLESAVALAAASGGPIEHARALLQLGGALRRANHRAAAREPLRAALDLAHRAGASRLAQRARTELGLAGARPRRAPSGGVESLTAAERRVAELAAGGLSNPQIARELYVTINTVEGHLRHVYRKLSIRSRAQLPRALDRGATPAHAQKTTEAP
jgi:DNA-binding CsgD family transcriptional regulator